MCEVRCLSFVSWLGCVLWCLLCDSVRILCCATFCVLCYCVLFAVKSVIRWCNVRGSVYVVVCVFPVCCDFCACDLCTVGTLLFVVCVCPVRISLWSAG